MADTKITSLLTPQVTTNPATDVLPIVNIADTSMASSGSTRKITVNSLLGAGGTATLASATISGDLTVDTSTLKVDSTNNRVGINIATPVAELHVVGGANFSDGTTTLRAVSSGNVAFLGTTTTDPLVLRVNNIEQYRMAQLGVFTWSDGAGGTRMTLNATGLGVGVTDTTNGRLSVRAGTAATGNSAFFQNLDGTYNSYLQIQHSSNGVKLFTNSSYGGDAGNLTIGCSSAVNALIVNGSGNVGIGVTPSYKLDTQVAGGADRSILRAAVTGVSGGFQVKWDNATSKIHAIIENIPTSSAGLPSGTLWSDSGTIKIA